MSIATSRRLPLPMKKNVQEQLQRLEKENIRPVRTPKTSPAVVKSDSPRSVLIKTVKFT